MWMNILGRSSNDLAQYPIFPWLIIIETSDKSITRKNNKE